MKRMLIARGLMAAGFAALLAAAGPAAAQTPAPAAVSPPAMAVPAHPAAPLKPAAPAAPAKPALTKPVVAQAKAAVHARVHHRRRMKPITKAEAAKIRQDLFYARSELRGAVARLHADRATHNRVILHQDRKLVRRLHVRIRHDVWALHRFERTQCVFPRRWHARHAWHEWRRHHHHHGHPHVGMKPASPAK